MSDNASEPGRTGRRRAPTEAAPSTVQPEDEAAVEEDENQIGGGGAIYFTKAKTKEVWHVFDENDENVGRVARDPSDGKWEIRIEGQRIESRYAAATSAKAFVSGYFYLHRLLVTGGDTPKTRRFEPTHAGQPGTSAADTMKTPQPPASAGRSPHQGEGRPVSDGTASSSTTSGGTVDTGIGR